MEPLGTWEAILLGAIALLVIFWFRPGIKATLEKSRQAKEKDWKSVLIPLVLVVAFVVFLIAIT
jgi:hypothetical protein